MNQRDIVRNHKTNMIKRFVNSWLQVHGELDYEYAIAYCIQEVGYNRRTAREYIDSMVTFKVVQRIGDKILPISPIKPQDEQKDVYPLS